MYKKHMLPLDTHLLDTHTCTRMAMIEWHICLYKHTSNWFNISFYIIVFYIWMYLKSGSFHFTLFSFLFLSRFVRCCNNWISLLDLWLKAMHIFGWPGCRLPSIRKKKKTTVTDFVCTFLLLCCNHMFLLPKVPPVHTQWCTHTHTHIYSHTCPWLSDRPS